MTINSKSMATVANLRAGAWVSANQTNLPSVTVHQSNEQEEDLGLHNE